MALILVSRTTWNQYKHYLNPVHNPNRYQKGKHWPTPSILFWVSGSPVQLARKLCLFITCVNLHMQVISQIYVSHCSGGKLELMGKCLYLVHVFWALWSVAKKNPASFRNQTLHFCSNQLCLHKMNRKGSLIKTAAHGAFAVYRCQLGTSVFKSLPGFAQCSESQLKGCVHTCNCVSFINQICWTLSRPQCSLEQT